ncbi:MAG TPA: hypothetical protein VGC93_09825, partial [Thermoanaerobaculia bacterium]
MIRRCLVLSLLPALWLAGGAAATTYVLGPDEQLADQAAVVLEGTVEAIGAAGGERPFTEYRVHVERLLKGRITGGEARVRVLGGERGDGLRFHAWGVPVLNEGERTLLFLVTHPDGAFRPLHLGMGIFREARVGGRALALRDLSGAQILTPEGGEAVERT